MRLLTANVRAIGVLVMLCFAAAIAPAAPVQQKVGAALNDAKFAPLQQWRAAVLAGNEAALRKFYLPDAPAFLLMADGQKATPAEQEAPFWAALGAQGLVDFAPKILQREEPQPNAVFFVLRVEMTFRAADGAMHQTVAPVRQTWVKQGTAWHIAATRRKPAEALQAITLPQPATPNPHLYPAIADAKKELDEALAAAHSDHKRVLVIFGATWCYDCHVLDATLRSASLAQFVAANYHVIHINVGAGDENADMAARFEVPLNKGIPSLAVLDGDGKLITSQKNGEFESAAKIGMNDVTGFLNQWKPTPAQ